MFPDRIFVTGTDTNVGKTFVSAVLLKLTGGSYWKPIQSGSIEGTDREFVQRVTVMSDEHFEKEVYCLREPLSPHAAAALENVTINLESIKIPQSTKQAPLIIEGAGGVLVPINDTALMIDLMAQFNAPTIVVARSTLGTINHTLLTLQALHSRQIPVLGVVMNGPPNDGNRKAIEHYGQVPVLAEIRNYSQCTEANIIDAGSAFRSKVTAG